MPELQNNGTLKNQSAPANSRKDLIYDYKADGQPRFQGCSRISAYEVLGKLGEGTFGLVHKARHIKNGHLVALKKVLMHNEKDGFPITALREIKLLKMLSHANILRLEEMAVESRRNEGKKKASMYMVTPYMSHDLSGLLENPAVRLTEPHIKCYMLQLLEGVRYLHSQKILHRDMKAANVLIDNNGILQIGDFGLARPYDEDPPQPGRGGGEASRDYTTLVVTRWYRPPELLLQLRRYTTAIDMWGVGCVFGEMFKKRPILAGKSDLNQIQLIFGLVGSPTEENMSGWSALPGFKKDGITSYGLSKGTLSTQFHDQGPVFISLLQNLLLLDWRKRINAIDALEHPYFKAHPLPAHPSDIPKFQESHELDRRKFRDQQAAPPPAPAGGDVGMGPQNGGEWGGQPNGANDYAPPRHSGVPPKRKDNSRPPHAAPYRSGRDQPPWNNNDRDEERYRNRGDRRPAWERPAHRPNNPPNNSLPPRPNFDASWSQLDGDSSRPPPRHHQGHPPRHNAQASAVDTYIPNYSDGSGEGPGRGRYDLPLPRHERSRAWDRDRERGLPYDGAARGRSRSPERDRDWERERERGRAEEWRR